MSRTGKSILSISVVAVLVIATLGISYASFTENLSGGDYASTINSTNGKLEAGYAGGSSLEISNVNPGSDAVYAKSFSVRGTNNNSNNLGYKIILVIDNNTYDNNVISYSLTSYNPIDNGEIIPSTENKVIATGQSEIELGTGYFNNADAVVHTYDIKFYLSAKAAKNAKLNAHIKVESN